MIREAVVTSRDADGGTHIAPMGVHERGELLGLAPFRPSTTLGNVLRERCVVINYTDDVRVIAGALTGRTDWPLAPAERIPGMRLRDALAHVELKLEHSEEDDQRSWLWCRPVHEATHRPFRGFNRAQMSVLEAAILVSRLDRLPWDKIRRELDYLEIGLRKTAGPRELEAWDWLMQAVQHHETQRVREVGA